MTISETWTAVAAIATCIYSLVTIITLLIITRQVSDGRRFSQAQFINELEKEFNKFSSVFDVMRQPDLLAKLADPTWNERHKFFECLDFFERVKTLLDTKTLNIKLVDRILGQPFFFIVNHPQIQKDIIYPSATRFAELFALHQQLSRYRVRRGQAIPLAETDLAKGNPAIYAANLELYRQIR